MLVVYFCVCGLEKVTHSQSCLYFPRAHRCQLADELNQNRLTRPSLPLAPTARVTSGHDAARGGKLTDFESRSLSRAVVVHLAHERAHRHGVLVLMVQAVSLKERNHSEHQWRGGTTRFINHLLSD